MTEGRTDGRTDRHPERSEGSLSVCHPERSEGSLSVALRSVRPSVRLSVLVLIGCQASTTRPTFAPLPGAATAAVHLGPERATRVLAEALKADSITLQFVHEGDGVIVSEWLEVPGYVRATGRALGPGTVRVRAWVDRGVISQADTSSVYTIETGYRVFADPSREERETEQGVAETHPARVKVVRLLDKLVKLYGDAVPEPADSTKPAVPPPPPSHGRMASGER